MTNPTSTSPTRISPLDNQPRRGLEVQAEHSLFKELLRLPPEEVLDFFRGRVGRSLLAGVLEWKRRSQEDSLRNARLACSNTLPRELAEIRTYVAAGIDEVCTEIVNLPEMVNKLKLNDLRKAKEK